MKNTKKFLSTGVVLAIVMFASAQITAAPVKPATEEQVQEVLILLGYMQAQIRQIQDAVNRLARG